MQIRSEFLVIIHLVDGRTLRKPNVGQLKDHGAGGHGRLDSLNELSVTRILSFEANIIRHKENVITCLIEDPYEQNNSERGLKDDRAFASVCSPANILEQQHHREQSKESQIHADPVVASHLRRDQ